ncbi:hypothetical protein [Methylobacterium terrae]|nr:hypothetical protein [Methylobacterium terrae]
MLAGLDEALRWHAEGGQRLLLTRHGAPNRATDCQQRMPLTFVIGRDVP